MRTIGIALAVMGSTLLGCGTTIALGEPGDTNAQPPTGNANANDAGTGALTSDGGAEDVSYAWRWASPAPTGVHLRNVFVLNANEKFMVGDGGAVVHQVGTSASNLRVGTLDETLSAVWASSANDVWVGGVRGTGGLLMHWDGAKWSDFPTASAQVRAIQGVAGGDLFLIIGNLVVRMDPHGVITESYSSTFSARDIWAQSSSEIWIAGDSGIARWDGLNGGLVLSTTPAISVWGDGNAHVYSASISNACLVVTDFSGDTSTPVGASTCAHYQAPRGDFVGKQIVGDGSGHLLALLHSEPPSDYQREGYAVYEPATSTWVTYDQKLTDRIYGLGAASGSIAFAGQTGFRGTFAGSSPVVESAAFRDDVNIGAASSDGAAFVVPAFGAAAPPAHWVEGTGWTYLPAVPDGYYAGATAAGSANDLWVGGFTLGNAQNNYIADYYALHWNGAAWSIGPSKTSNMFRPLYSSAPDDVWAWQDYDLMHYDGHTWEKRFGGGLGTGGIQLASGRSKDDVYFIDELAGLYHWDGSSMPTITGVPSSFITLATSAGHLVEGSDGSAWFVGVSENAASSYAEYVSIFHWKDGALTKVDVPGLAIDGLAEGPDGKMRMLARPSNMGIQLAAASSTIYVVDDSGVTPELAIPAVLLQSIFRAGSYVYAVGNSGATLRLEPAQTSRVP